MPSILERLRKLKRKETPADRLLKGKFTEEDKEKFLPGFKEDKRKKERKKALGK